MPEALPPLPEDPCLDVGLPSSPSSLLSAPTSQPPFLEVRFPPSKRLRQESCQGSVGEEASRRKRRGWQEELRRCKARVEARNRERVEARVEARGRERMEARVEARGREGMEARVEARGREGLPLCHTWTAGTCSNR